MLKIKIKSLNNNQFYIRIVGLTVKFYPIIIRINIISVNVLTHGIMIDPFLR